MLEDNKNPLPALLLSSEEVHIDISDVVSTERVLYRNKVLFDIEMGICYHL